MVPRIYFLFCLLASLTLHAQEKDIYPFQLGENDLALDADSTKIKITTASRSVKILEDLPVTVYVVSRHTILENGYNTLVDVLKDVPGIKVSQPGSGIEGETFLMNGMFGNYYCKILVNGIPITPSVASGTAITGNLPVRQAERIEIISGPAAALYGSDALAGVVNIITHESDRPVWTQADLSVGSQGAYSMNVMIGGKFGKNKNVAEYNLYGNYGQVADMKIKYDVAGNYDTSLYQSATGSEPYYRGSANEPVFSKLPNSRSLIGFGLKYRGIKADYEHLSRRNHSSIGQNTRSYAYYDPTAYWGENIDRFSLSYSNTWNKLTSTTQLSLLVYRLDNNSSFRMVTERGNEGRVYKYAASDDIFFDEILSYKINKNIELSGGVFMQASGNLPVTNDLPEPFDPDNYTPFSKEVSESDSLMGSFGINPNNFFNLAGYLQLYYSFGRFNLMAGARWDHHSIFGSNLSPKAGILYKPHETLSFRVNYGHGFRVPSLFYVYRSIAYPYVNDGRQEIIYENLPNPDVKAEKFRAFEFGIRYKPHKKVYFDLIFLYHKLVENISYTITGIDTVKYPNPANLIALVAANDPESSAELYIGQINIRWKDIIPSIKLSSDLYITYSRGKEVLPNGWGTLNDYRNIPRWFVQWNLNLQPARKWTVILNNIFSDKWKKRFFPVPLDNLEAAGFPSETDGYFTLDLTNRFKINRNFHAFLIINNVLNAEYGGIDAYGGAYDLIYNPQYGRNFRLGFSFTME